MIPFILSDIENVNIVHCVESVTSLQGFLGRPTWEMLVEKRVANFEKRIRDSEAKGLAHAFID